MIFATISTVLFIFFFSILLQLCADPELRCHIGSSEDMRFLRSLRSARRAAPACCALTGESGRSGESDERVLDESKLLLLLTDDANRMPLLELR